MILKLFTKPDCPRCPAAKSLIEKIASSGDKLQIERYDAGTVDGMAEAAFYTVMSTPTILLCDENGKEIYGWRGETPSLDDLKSRIK